MFKIIMHFLHDFSKYFLFFLRHGFHEIIDDPVKEIFMKCADALPFLTQFYTDGTPIGL